MHVKAKKQFSSAELGNVAEGQILPVSPGHGQHLINAGLAEAYSTGGETYSTKVVREVPTDAGPEKPSGSSRPARRSRSKTAKRSAASESSSSTPASD